MGEDPTQPDETRDDRERESNLPGARWLRDVIANAPKRILPTKGDIRDDAVAGLNSAVSSVPSGLASGLLVGVNPIYGLYGMMTGPIVGGFLASTKLMVINPTSAAALAAGQALISVPDDQRASALFVMVMMVGVIQIAFGLLRLGSLIRFVSYPVMLGLLAGIGMLTILSQIPTITGYAAEGDTNLEQAVDVFANLGQIDVPSLGIAVLSLVLVLVLPRTKLGNFGWIIAIAVPSIVVALFNMGSVEIVQDIGEIPSGFPPPFIPSLSDLSYELLSGALAVAVIILVQGAGVSQSVPNSDGSRIDLSRDFIAQGAANVAAGVFRGLPPGGSLSATAVNVLSGARSRWAGVFSGLWVAIIVVFFPGSVSYVAMPALGVLLMVAISSSIRPIAAYSVWKTQWPSGVALIVTFLAMLLLPIQAAVGLGVVLSALFAVNQASADVSVTQYIRHDDGRVEEREAPETLMAHELTVLDIHGPLSYGGAQTVEEQLPNAQGVERAAVVLRLRGHRVVGATFIDVIATYADTLKEGGGRLYLSGLDEGVRRQLDASGWLPLGEDVHAYDVTRFMGESTQEAIDDARDWLARQQDGESSDDDSSDDREDV